MKLILQIVLGILLGGVLLAYIEPLLPPLLVPGLNDKAAEEKSVLALRRVVELQEAQLAELRAQSGRAEQHQQLLASQLIQLTAGLGEQLLPPENSEPQDGAGISAAETEPGLFSEEEQRKEIAWKEFYIAPEECQNMNTRDAVVECGNYHIRKRREFEGLWEQGLVK